jgi:hypothetical protein
MSVEYDVDFREHPEAYHYRRGEQDVFKVQSYKDELLPHWGFKDEDLAQKAVAAIRTKYEAYREREDFVGMDVVHKFLQMGFTRAKRYAKYPGGRKYDDDGTERAPQQWAAPAKRAAAVVFRDAWQAVTDDPAYQPLKERPQEQVCDPAASPIANE